MRVTVIAHFVRSIQIAHLGPSGQSGAIVARLGQMASRSTHALGFAAAPGRLAKDLSATVVFAVTRKRRNRNAAEMIARLPTGMSGRHATRVAGTRPRPTRGPSFKTHFVGGMSARIFRKRPRVRKMIPVKEIPPVKYRRATTRNVATVKQALGRTGACAIGPA